MFYAFLNIITCLIIFDDDEFENEIFEYVSNINTIEIILFELAVLLIVLIAIWKYVFLLISKKCKFVKMVL